MIRISIVVIAYNQEKLIRRALDSILIQREYVYELIICDDCSTDSTWEIILDYYSKYPSLIKPFRNNNNLGIFGNIENSWSKVYGDIVFYLAGDDEFCNGVFFETAKYIDQNNIDYKNELFSLYFDFKILYPNKNLSYVSKNNIILKGYDSISLKIRGLISNAAVAYSVQLIKLFKPINKKIGYFADGLLDIQVQMNSKKNYYLPYVALIHYANIGVSKNISTKDTYISLFETHQEFKKILNLQKKDIIFLDYKFEKYKLLSEPTMKHFFCTIKYYFNSVNLQYGLKGLSIKQVIIDLYKLIRAILSYVKKQ